MKSIKFGEITKECDVCFELFKKNDCWDLIEHRKNTAKGKEKEITKRHHYYGRLDQLCFAMHDKCIVLKGIKNSIEIAQEKIVMALEDIGGLK